MYMRGVCIYIRYRVVFSGLTASLPRSERETDHNFAEPALFVVNEDGRLHVEEYSNNPFVRADLPTLVRGLKWIRKPENDYPIRGTAGYDA